MMKYEDVANTPLARKNDARLGKMHIYWTPANADSKTAGRMSVGFAESIGDNWDVRRARYERCAGGREVWDLNLAGRTFYLLTTICRMQDDGIDREDIFDSLAAIPEFNRFLCWLMEQHGQREWGDIEAFSRYVSAHVGHPDFAEQSCLRAIG